MISTEWIGYGAAVLTTLSFVPQVWQIWTTRHTKDISLRMYILFTGGVSLWLLYGLLLGSWPIIVANCVTLVLAGMVLALKLRHG
ncbi:SemiSWEET transporter [Propionivibrio sp.]|uniref:SemiSWEET transporter n=1 Tax=Propionivibrio sp. TaxID=2212460 RepID=UPI00272E7EA6|nr:SemiSWEET transporter [Propionivibrio sp.]